MRHDRRDEWKELDAQESRRRSRRKIAVADDTGQGKDVKNGAMPNECHLTRKTKGRGCKGNGKRYGKSEREREIQEAPHVGLSDVLKK